MLYLHNCKLLAYIYNGHHTWSFVCRFLKSTNFQSIKVKVVPTTEQGSVDRKTYTPNVVFTQLQVIGIYLQRPSHMVICMSLSQEHEFPEYKGQGSTNH